MSRSLRQEREQLDEAFSNIHEVDDMDGFDRMSYHSSQEMGKASNGVSGCASSTSERRA